MTYRNEILQTMLTKEKIQAVYYQPKPKGLLRVRVLGWLRIRRSEVNRNADPVQHVLPAIWDGGGCCWEDATSHSNFVGLEFEGKEKSWEPEIKGLEERGLEK